MVSLEAIACGRPVLAYVLSEYPENREFPLKDLKDEEEIVHTIKTLPTCFLVLPALFTFSFVL